MPAFSCMIPTNEKTFTFKWQYFPFVEGVVLHNYIENYFKQSLMYMLLVWTNFHSNV